MPHATESPRSWELKKAKLRRTLDDFVLRSPNLKLHYSDDLGDELRTVVEFAVPTLVRLPGDQPRLLGPVVCGIRYHRDFMSLPPIPWEIVTVLEPLFVYHPSVNAGAGLCIGHPVANLTMEEILHTTWAGLVFNSRIINTIDWQVFNPHAASYVRNAPEGTFPITPRGLMEAPTPEEAARLAPRLLRSSRGALPTSSYPLPLVFRSLCGRMAGEVFWELFGA